jgi:hypothetical protein
LGVVFASKQHVLGQSCGDEASLHLILSVDGNSHESTTQQKTILCHFKMTPQPQLRWSEVKRKQ